MCLVKSKVSPDPKVIKLFSCSTQLNMKLLFHVNIVEDKISGKVRSISVMLVTYLANECQNASNNCWHFNINEQD